MNLDRVLELSFHHREPFRHVFGNPADKEIRARLETGQCAQTALTQQSVIEETVQDPRVPRWVSGSAGAGLARCGSLVGWNGGKVNRWTVRICFISGTDCWLFVRPRGRG